MSSQGTQEGRGVSSSEDELLLSEVGELSEARVADKLSSNWIAGGESRSGLITVGRAYKSAQRCLQLT